MDANKLLTQSEGYSPIHLAVEKGREEMVELLLSKGAEINALRKGKTPLHIATQNGYSHMVKLLLKHGADVDCVSTCNIYNEYTALHFAAERGSCEVVTLLLKAGAMVNVYASGYTPLHIVARKGSYYDAENLLNHGADVHCMSTCKLNMEYTALHFAAEKGSYKLIQLLVCHGSNINQYASGYTPLHLAARKGHYDAVENFLKHGANINCSCTSELNEGYTSVHFASEAGSFEVVKLLLSKGSAADNVANGYTPLHIAAKYGYSLVVELLLQHGADLNCVCTSELNEGYTSMHFAAEKGSLEIVNLLLNAGAKFNENANGFTPLHIAAQKGHFLVTEHLLKHGVGVNFPGASKQNEGYSPLSLAVLHGHKEVASILLKYGCSVDHQGNTGKTCLLLAVEKIDLSMVELILQNSPDVNNECNMKSLIIAVSYKEESSRISERLLQQGFPDNMTADRIVIPYMSDKEKMCRSITERLLNYGFTVSPNEGGNYGFLFCSIRNGYVTIVEQLLKYGAQVNHSWCSNSFDQGYMPLHYAVIHGQLEVVQMLLTWNADVNAHDKSGNTPLFYAFQNGNIPIIRLLLSHIGNINKYPELMILAVKMYKKEIISVLVQCGADVNFRDENGRTTLHVTDCNKKYMVHCQYGKGSDYVERESDELVLRDEAMENSHCESVYLPIHVAAQLGKVDVVEALLSLNADVNSICKCGLTPLHIAVLEGHVQVVKSLLKSDVVIDYMGESRRTALHIACERGEDDIVRALLDHGSDITIIDGNNQTPLGLAEKILSQQGDGDSCHDDYDFPELYFNYESSFGIFKCSKYKRICDMLQLHLIKSENLHISWKNVLSIDRGSKMNFHDRCMAELQMLRNIKVNNTVFSHYDILTKSMHELALLLENENVSQNIRTNVCEKKFPVYASVICSHFRMAEQRRKLLREVNEYCFQIFPGLTWDCVQVVLSYLSNADLWNLIYLCSLAGAYGHVSSDQNDAVVGES